MAREEIALTRFTLDLIRQQDSLRATADAISGLNRHIASEMGKRALEHLALAAGAAGRTARASPNFCVVRAATTKRGGRAVTKLELQSENHRLRLAITEAMKVWSFDKAKALLVKSLTTSNLKRVVRI